MKAEQFQFQGFATAEEAAAFLRLSLRQVQKCCKAGTIPGKKFGKNWRIPWVWLRKQERLGATAD